MLPFRHAQLVLCFVVSLPVCVYAAEPVSSTAIETVLVKGQQYKIELEKERALTPGAVTLVDSEELFERNVTNLADMLRYVPGMWVASGSTGDSTFFSSRGSNLDATNYDGNGIKLLQDGLPVTTADGNNHNRNIDPLSTRFAVVARGANALTYGASTLGGAIDFISPTARDTESMLYINAGSNSQAQGQLTAGKVDGNFDGLVTIETRNWDGYREHQQQRRESVYANAGWQLSDATKSRIYLSYINNDQELPGALTAQEFEQDPYQPQQAAVVGNYQYNVKSWRIANKTEWNLSENSSLSFGLSYEEQALYHPIVYSPFFSLLIDTDQDNAGASLRYNLRLGTHDMLAGINYGESTVNGGNYSHKAGQRGDLMTIVDNNADSLEVFLVDRWQIAPKWKVIYGAQAVSGGREVRNTDVASGDLYNPKGDFDSINPRLGFIYEMQPEVELFANLSRLYEPPTNFELEDDASADGTALDAMQGEVIELGTRGNNKLSPLNQWHWELAFYYGHLQDEILSVDDPAAPGTSLSANVDNTIHAGIEALFGTSLALDKAGVHRIEPMLNLTFNKFSFDNDSTYGNNELPAAPGYAVKGEILYRNSNGWFVGPTFDIVDQRYADFSNTYTVDSYTLLGLRSGYSGKSWEIFGEARNLADEEYVSVFNVKDTAAESDAILQAGESRSIYVGLKLQF